MLKNAACGKLAKILRAVAVLAQTKVYLFLEAARLVSFYYVHVRGRLLSVSSLSLLPECILVLEKAYLVNLSNSELL